MANTVRTRAFEVLERERVVLGVERELVPLVGEPLGERERRVAAVLLAGFGVATEVVRSNGGPGSPGGPR